MFVNNSITYIYKPKLNQKKVCFKNLKSKDWIVYIIYKIYTSKLKSEKNLLKI